MYDSWHQFEMSREYNPIKRENDPLYLLRQAQELCKIAKANENSSALIYSCLECRLALENLDLNLILASVNENERLQILEDSKPKNGIDSLNKKRGSLKHKYQQFLQAVTEILDLPSKYYDYRKSKDIQHQLSFYIHSYCFTESEIHYDSATMSKVFELVEDVNNFIFESLPRDGDSVIMMNMEIANMPQENRVLLDEWKKSDIEDFDELKKKLQVNLDKRQK